MPRPHSRARQWISTRHTVEGLPRHPRFVGTTTEPLLPSRTRFVQERCQGARVPSHSIVAVETTKLSPEDLRLFPYRSVAYTPHLLVDRSQRSREPLRGRLALRNPTALTRPRPVMGEAQEVEAPWTRSTSIPSWTTERDQPGLVWMQRQPEAPETNLLFFFLQSS